MTEEKKYLTKYLTKEDIQIIHNLLSEKFEEVGEPIPAFSFAKQNKVESLVDLPKRSFFGIDAYPTLFDKAAIIFYSINKDQIFANGNKRMSTACLAVFLIINGRALNVSPDDLTRKALELAKTDSLEFQTVKQNLCDWLQNNTIDIEGDSLE